MELHTLAAKVNDATTAKESGRVLVSGIAELVTAAGTDPDSLAALRNGLVEYEDTLADAVAANLDA
jgi:hypothetical protein